MNKVAREATEKLEKMKAEKAKQQDNNESSVDKCQIGRKQFKLKTFALLIQLSKKNSK